MGNSLLQPATTIQRSFKGGFFGSGGSGKTLTATLIAIGLSKTYHDAAPIAFVDTEDQSDFMIPICQAEGVPLHVVKSRSFIDMRDALREAEESCCAFIVDSYSHSARELEEALKVKLNMVGRRMAYHQREQLFSIWGEWVREMRASPLHVLLNGRLSFEWDQVDDEDGDSQVVKVGTKMRGDSDAGYEPDLLVELEAVRTSLVRDKTTKTKRGNMKHAAVILKDRWMAMNGKTIVWPDNNGYVVGDYKAVFEKFLPHLERLNIGPLRRESVSRSSDVLFSAPRGESPFAERARRVTVAVEEIQAAIRAIWPGETAAEKKLRAIVLQTVFKTRSWAAIESMTVESVEEGWRVIQHMEAHMEGVDPQSEQEVTALIAACKTLESDRVEAVGGVF